ncbi:hypothetical protein HMI56_006687 [Coelomomyces lativittatus]|nr:hypothetical protein HMI56_006687 [Coelomomyces lativittatus]
MYINLPPLKVEIYSMNFIFYSVFVFVSTLDTWKVTGFPIAWVALPSIFNTSHNFMQPMPLPFDHLFDKKDFPYPIHADVFSSSFLPSSFPSSSSSTSSASNDPKVIFAHLKPRQLSLSTQVPLEVSSSGSINVSAQPIIPIDVMALDPKPSMGVDPATPFMVVIDANEGEETHGFNQEGSSEESIRITSVEIDAPENVEVDLEMEMEDHHEDQREQSENMMNDIAIEVENAIPISEADRTVATVSVSSAREGVNDRVRNASMDRSRAVIENENEVSEASNGLDLSSKEQSIDSLDVSKQTETSQGDENEKLQEEDGLEELSNENNGVLKFHYGWWW